MAEIQPIDPIGPAVESAIVPVAGDEGSRMTLLAHLKELRSRLVRSALAMLAGFIAAYLWAGIVLATQMRVARAFDKRQELSLGRRGKKLLPML